MRSKKPSAKPSSLFQYALLVSVICTCTGSGLMLLEANVALRLRSLFTGERLFSDLTAMPIALYLSCMALFIPVVLGVLLLIAILRVQLRKGRLTPNIGIRLGIVLWGLGGILFCLVLIFSNPFPPEPSLGPRNFWTRIPQILDEWSLSGILIACLVGGWAGHVLTKKILSTQPSSLEDHKLVS